MSTTDILQKNILDLAPLTGFDHRTWIELERGGASSVRESMDGLRYSWINLTPNDFHAANGASLARIARYSYVSFPNSTASGDPTAFTSVYPAKGLRPGAVITALRWWTFTTAAASSQLAVMRATLEWPDGNQFDISSATTNQRTENTQVLGSSAIDALTYTEDSNLTGPIVIGDQGWSHAAVSVFRNAGGASDTLGIGLNLLLLQLQIGTTST